MLGFERCHIAPANKSWCKVVKSGKELAEVRARW